MTTFASPVHSAESEKKIAYYCQKIMIGMINPLSAGMDKLFISPKRGFSSDSELIPSDHPVCTDDGLAITLTAIKFLEKLYAIKHNLNIGDEIESEARTLQVICDAIINKGAPVTSNYNVSPDSGYIKILRSQTPIPVYKLIDNWFEQELHLVDKEAKNRLIVAISESKRDRKERVNFELKENEMPQDLIDLIHLFIEHKIDDEN